uniref:Uncharacterized protein n=1 Tax=candidate division CPR3 bacterium TaxID=2268181 RepID=A0A7C4R524_UNCC3
MEEEKETPQEEIKEIIEEVKEDIEKLEDVVEKIEEKNSEEGKEEEKETPENANIKQEDREEQEKPNTKEKKPSNLISYILISVLVLAAIALIIVDYPKIVNLLKNQTGFDFDYNFSKVRDLDWDTLITEKKVASAIGTPLQKINSAKNPDYSWVLQDPEKFVNEIKCASLVDTKILNEVSEENKNLFNINITVCKDKQEAEKMFSERKEETDSVSKSNESIELKKMEEFNNIGDKGYFYLIERIGAPENPDDPESAKLPGEQFSGTAFIRGPFVIMIDESNQQGMADISEEETLKRLMNYIDKELKRTLSWL